MIGIRIWTRTQTVWMVAGALAIGLSLPAGCGGGSGGGGTSTNDNDNQNQNGTDPGNDNQNGNTNGNSNGDDNGNSNGNGNGNGNGNEDALTAEIGGLPVGDLEVGQQIELHANVTNDIGDLTYEWMVDRDDLATLSATDIANPILTTIAEGPVKIVLAVHDSAANDVETVQQVQIVGVPDPPVEALLSVVPVGIVGTLEAVSLLATLGGPTPVSASWEPSPDNVFNAATLFFENQDSGDETLILATLVTTNILSTYTLTFTITAVYSNGGSLSEDVVLTVIDGP